MPSLQHNCNKTALGKLHFIQHLFHMTNTTLTSLLQSLQAALDYTNGFKLLLDR